VGRLHEEWVEDRTRFHEAFVDLLDAYEGFDGSDRDEDRWEELVAAVHLVSQSLDAMELTREGMTRTPDGRKLQSP